MCNFFNSKYAYTGRLPQPTRIFLMNLSEKRRLHEIMSVHGVPEQAQINILNEFQKPPRDAQWVRLQAPLDSAIRTTRNARAGWRPNRAPIYGAYLTLLERVRAEIRHDARTYATPEDAAKAAKTTNLQRASEGKRPLGAKDGPWWTWIPPHIHAATIIAFETLYSSPEERAKPAGRRITPFATLTQRTDARKRWLALLDHARPHMQAGFDVPPSEVEQLTRGIEPERQQEVALALARVHRERYRAAHAAAKIIRAQAQSLGNLVVPIDWTHVLAPPERARLRAAEIAAGGDGYTRDRSVMMAQVPPAAQAGMGYVGELDTGLKKENEDDIL
jgi:hypothetical protein